MRTNRGSFAVRSHHESDWPGNRHLASLVCSKTRTTGHAQTDVLGKRIPHRTTITDVIRTLIALLFVLAACTPQVDPTAQPTNSPTPQPTDSPTPEPTADATPEATPQSSEGSFGGFSIAANAEADALFEATNSCQNIDDGYEVDFPAEWNANAEFGSQPPCSWFAATEYETGEPGSVPDEVAIVIFRLEGERTYGDTEVSDREEGFVGVTQPAYRVTIVDGDETLYEYVIQLGPTPEEGPNLVAITSMEAGGDFELNQAVLDRMMASMELIGSIE